MLRSLCLLLVLLASPAGAALEGKQQELSSLRDRISQLRNELERATEDRGDAADALRGSEKRISDVNRALRDLQHTEADLSRELASLAESSRDSEHRLRNQQRQLSELLRAHYLRSGSEPAKLLLSGRDPAEIRRALTYFTYIGRARAGLIDAQRQTVTQLADLKAQTLRRKSALREVKARQLSERQTLEKEKTAREKVLRSLSQQIRQQRREIDSLRRDETRLTRLVEELKRLAKKPKPSRKSAGKAPAAPGEKVSRVADASLAGINFARLRGKLALPVAGEILSRFGQARAGGGPAWKGVFIRAASGQPVRAVASGLVVFADWLRGFGNLLILDHGDGYLSLYSNNESLYKQAGESVKAGDTVATVGNTGGQSDPGLYFELRHQGRPFDPMAWVK